MATYYGTITAIANTKAAFLLTIKDETGRVFATFPAFSREEAETRRTDILKMLEDGGRKWSERT